MNIQTELRKNINGVRQVLGLVRWWWLIRARYYSIGILLLSLPFWFLSGVFRESGILNSIFAAIGIIGVIVAGFAFLISILAPIGVYKERKNLPKTGEWYPSRWYYLTIFPDGILALVLSYVYGRRRLRHYGNRSYSQIRE